MALFAGPQHPNFFSKNRMVPIKKTQNLCKWSKQLFNQYAYTEKMEHIPWNFQMLVGSGWFSSHDELQKDSSIFTIVHINQIIIQIFKQEHVKQRGTTLTPLVYHLMKKLKIDVGIKFEGKKTIFVFWRIPRTQK